MAYGDPIDDQIVRVLHNFSALDLPNIGMNYLVFLSQEILAAYKCRIMLTQRDQHLKIIGKISVLRRKSRKKASSCLRRQIYSTLLLATVSMMSSSSELTI